MIIVIVFVLQLLLKYLTYKICVEKDNSVCEEFKKRILLMLLRNMFFVVLVLIILISFDFNILNYNYYVELKKDSLGVSSSINTLIAEMLKYSATAFLLTCSLDAFCDYLYFKKLGKRAPILQGLFSQGIIIVGYSVVINSTKFFANPTIINNSVKYNDIIMRISLIFGILFIPCFIISIIKYKKDNKKYRV